MSTKRDERGNYVNHADPYKYQAGFNNHFSTEAVKRALPQGQNAPQKCNYGLYAEQLSGTAFTAPRAQNRKSWLYRIRPSAAHQQYEGPLQDEIANMKDKKGNLRLVNDFSKNGTPEQFRWMPPTMKGDYSGSSSNSVDFADGLFHVCGAGSPQMKSGLGIMMYLCNKDMAHRAMVSSDGDMLIVPQQGTLKIQTEMGWMQVQPTEICVIPRGIKFSVFVNDSEKTDQQDVSEYCRGYVAEVHHGQFILPELGPIGASGLANPRDFEYPIACFIDDDQPFEVVHKYQNKLFRAQMDHSVFDVVAWHGNLAPFKYDLKKFNTMNTVSYDHPDPCIYTVLTCQSEQPGTAVLDFVIFPPRWSVSENTFRPPYYHRNTMNEYMGLIYGGYEAKEKGFVPGGSSLHSCMAAHGPESEVTYKNETSELKPARVADGSMAFMFESAYMLNPTDYALARLEKDKDYMSHWNNAKKRFDTSTLPEGALLQ